MTAAEVLEGVVTAMRRQQDVIDCQAEALEELEDSLSDVLGRLAALEARVEADEAGR